MSNQMSNPLAKKISFISILKFTAPTIIMMVFMSLYTMVDGVFVSNIIGENALSAVNIVYPAQGVILAVAIMLATGGSAIIAKKMGENDHFGAKDSFTLIVLVGIVVGLAIAVLGLAFLTPMIKVLGATAVLVTYCYEYLGILLLFAPFAVLQMLFQFFFVTAGKPKLGLFSTVGGGLANIVLDYVFMVNFDMGIGGAALATGIGYSVPALFGLFYFWRHKHGTLHFVKPHFDGKMLQKSCGNGASEMVTNLATAVITFLFNIIMLKHLGESGVAAITIVLYSQFLLTAIYLGFSSGIAPLFSYNYGEGNQNRLKKLYKNSMLFIGGSAILIYALALVFSGGIVSVFARPESQVYAIAINGFRLFSISYLFTGFNIFASAMFTALSNGKVSAIISFARTFVCIIVALLVLPAMLGTNGIWLAVPFAEAVTLILSVLYLVGLKGQYQY